jgi:hypothetical protein
MVNKIIQEPNKCALHNNHSMYMFLCIYVVKINLKRLTKISFPKLKIAAIIDIIKTEN